MGEEEGPSRKEDPSGETARAADIGRIRPGGPLPPDLWAELRAPFRAAAYATRIVATAEQTTKALVRFELFPEALEDRLLDVLGPGGYSSDFEHVPAGGEKIVRCRLRIGGAARAGAASGSEWRYTEGRAQVRAALRFGIGKEGEDASPIVADLEHKIKVPQDVQDRLERPREKTRWAPEEN